MIDETADTAEAGSAVPPPEPVEGSGGSPDHPPPAEGDVEYEYVYEDEDGNPIAPPPGGFDPQHFEEEVVQVVDDRPAPEGGPASATAETVTIAPGEVSRQAGPASSKRTTVTRSSRRRPGSQSGRISSRQSSPVEMKYAKLKTILMVSSLALIPVLTIAILLTHCYKKGYWPFRRGPKTVLVKSDVELALDIRSRAFRAYSQARDLAQAGKDTEAYNLFSMAETDFVKARDLLQGWRDKNPAPEYSYLDERIADINIKLREARESKFRIEMRPRK